MNAHIRKAEYKNKRGRNHLPRLPIPDQGDPQSEDWRVYYGRLEGIYVAIYDPEEAEILAKQGFFGRSSISYKSDNKELVEKRFKYGRKKDWENVENDDILPKNEEISSDEKLSRHCSKWLLCFEEALFLSYGLGTLVVSLPNNQLLTIDDMWRIFTKRRVTFPVQCAAYHHYRSKDWIVKNGLKSGSDWALYPDGPPFSHAQFLVWVKCIWSDDGSDGFRDSNRTYSLETFSALDRVSNSVSKNLMLCTVIRPKSLTDDKLRDISCLSKFQIEEVVMQRWMPEQF